MGRVYEPSRDELEGFNVTLGSLDSWATARGANVWNTYIRGKSFFSLNKGEGFLKGHISGTAGVAVAVEEMLLRLRDPSIVLELVVGFDGCGSSKGPASSCTFSLVFGGRNDSSPSISVPVKIFSCNSRRKQGQGCKYRKH